MELISDLISLGGTARTSQLLRLGHGSHSLTAAVRSGAVLRIRKGHYGLVADGPAHLAYRVGGHLAGLSALASRGVWVPQGTHPLEVSVLPNTSRLHRPGDARRLLRDGEALVHWDARAVQRSAPFAESADRAIRRLVGRVAVDDLFAILESALLQRQLSRSRADALRRHLADRVDERFLLAGWLSGSGAESKVVFWLHGTGLPFVQQAEIEDVGQVDTLIGERQIVEVDGERFHAGTVEFEKDRRRQVMASVRGYRTLRVSARMVESDLDLVVAAISAAVARGDHLAG